MSALLYEVLVTIIIFLILSVIKDKEYIKNSPISNFQLSTRNIAQIVKGFFRWAIIPETNKIIEAGLIDGKAQSLFLFIGVFFAPCLMLFFYYLDSKGENMPMFGWAMPLGLVFLSVTLFLNSENEGRT